MGSDKDNRRNAFEIFNRQRKSPARTSGGIPDCRTLLLTALLVVGLWVTPSLAAECDSCISCHGNLADVHGNFDHSATLGSDSVMIFADTDHDSAGMYGEPPYFAVTVDCSTCHYNDLVAVHGNDCATCHPSPYNTLGTWQRGCQQGGCHPAYHKDATKAHLPWGETNFNTANNCDLCHQPNSFQVTQSECLNCHATYGPANNTPPVTSTNALTAYIGPAKIDFSIDSGGKVGIGRTFSRLNGGPETAGNKLFVSAPGQHVLEFWSMDQSGNVESQPKSTSFNIVEDVTPPTTISNAAESYYQGGRITLTATDDGTLGVKNTFYSLNGSPTQTGTIVDIPTTSGTYTLTFWSVDWSNNIEPTNSVTFTVTGGTGTIRLVWGNSDSSGSPCPSDPEAKATWTIRRDSYHGSVVASGSDSCPNWSGVNDISFPVGPTPYTVIVDWWDSYSEYDDQTVFSNVYVTTPDEVVRLSY